LNAVPAGQLDDAFWQQLLLVRDEVNKVIEGARKEGKVGASLQAEVTLFANGDLASALQKVASELRFVLITSTAEVSTVAAPADAVATGIQGLSVWVAASSAPKCDRCWHHRHDVGANPAHPDICLRCVDNVEGAGEPRVFA
jgi:isoleucyl-tRNA synthetase